MRTRVQNKGTEENPDIRCRLVARDFRCPNKDREDVFAATPPWELKKLLMSHAADRSGGKTHKMLPSDFKKAHLSAEWTNVVFTELLDGVVPAQDKICKLRCWLYGFRPAAAAWEAQLRKQVGRKSVSGGGWLTLVWFHHAEKDVNLVVHGDDFTFTGDEAVLKWAEELMNGWYEVRGSALMGPDDHDDKEAAPKDGRSGEFRARRIQNTGC